MCYNEFQQQKYYNLIYNTYVTLQSFYSSLFKYMIYKRWIISSLYNRLSKHIALFADFNLFSNLILSIEFCKGMKYFFIKFLLGNFSVCIALHLGCCCLHQVFLKITSKSAGWIFFPNLIQQTPTWTSNRFV